MRHVTLEIEGRRWRTAIDQPISIAIPLDFEGPQPKAFGLDDAAAEPVGFGGQLADVEVGAAFNCASLRLVPHGNGTHTECAAHVTDTDLRVGGLAEESLIPATLVTVDTTEFGQTQNTYVEAASAGDLVVTDSDLVEAVARTDLPEEFLRALVIRTTPNDSSKRSRDYSGTNPPYLTREAVEWIRDREVEHLLVDLPSVDREDDGGALLNHRLFWGLAEEGHEAGAGEREACTITEMVYAPDEASDGAYFVDIELPDFGLDAAPSRPLLYEAKPATRR
jgi:kynurenine formamidase